MSICNQEANSSSWSPSGTYQEKNFEAMLSMARGGGPSGRGATEGSIEQSRPVSEGITELAFCRR